MNVGLLNNVRRTNQSGLIAVLSLIPLNWYEDDTNHFSCYIFPNLTMQIMLSYIYTTDEIFIKADYEPMNLKKHFKSYHISYYVLQDFKYYSSNNDFDHSHGESSFKNSVLTFYSLDPWFRYM